MNKHPLQSQTFGKNLCEARHKANLTQEQLADRADVDRAAISMYEHSRREPNLSTMVKLAHALDVQVATLVRGL
jgi:transcriptional regulator with XRE-family HTH domain